jgi:hypothetical protein
MSTMSDTLANHWVASSRLQSTNFFLAAWCQCLKKKTFLRLITRSNKLYPFWSGLIFEIKGRSLTLKRVPSLLANIRQDTKLISMSNNSMYFASSSVKKCLMALIIDGNVKKITFLSLMMRPSKLDHLLLAILSYQVLYFTISPEACN